MDRQAPFSEGDAILIGISSNEARQGFVAAMKERLGSSVQGADMLTMIPKPFSRTFSVMDGSEPVAHAVDLSWWSDKGALTVKGVTYTARREGVMSGAWVLESVAGAVARATKPSALRRSLIVEHAGRHYTLRAASVLGREFVLFDGATRIGSLSREGIFTRRAAVDLPSTMPIVLRVFVIWLTVRLWKHERSM